MASDLKFEIFAYKWFHRILLDNEVLPCVYDVEEAYKDEYLAYPECMEASECCDFYDAILVRGWLFNKLYLEEIKSQRNEFRHSRIDFYYYVLRTCDRVDLFGNLTIFERIFATFAFVCSLCLYCSENECPEIMRCGYIFWAMYFDKFIDEFYKQGGWTQLKMVAISYKLPLDFLTTEIAEERTDTTLMKIRKAIKRYNLFRKIGKIDHDKSISVSWVKFYILHIDERSDNDFYQLTEESHSNDIKHCSEVEDILKQLKYLCDPNGSEILKALCRKSTTDSLETSIANLNICDKYVNLESKEETILATELEQNTTFINLASKSAVEENVKALLINSEISPKRNNLLKIGSVSEAHCIKTENYPLKSQEQDLKTTIVEHLFEIMTISKLKSETEVKKNTILSKQLPSIKKNTERGDSNKIIHGTRKEKDEWKVIKGGNKNTILSGQIPSTENNAEKKNIKTQNDTRTEQNEWKLIKGAKRRTSLIGQISPTKKSAEKKNSNKTQDEVRKEQEEWKDTKKITIPREEKNDERKISSEIKYETRQAYIDERQEVKNNTILIGEMSSTRKNAEEENKKTGNSIQKEQEDGDIKIFLRMLLVLGDNQGISYVRKTATISNK